MRQLVDQVMNALDGSIDHNSAAIQTMNIFQMSAQVVATGASTGTVKLQFSNDIVNPSTPPAAPTHWSDIPSATVSVSAAGVFAIPKTDICYEFVRVVYTHTNGSAGTISVNIKALGE